MAALSHIPRILHRKSHPLPPLRSALCLLLSSFILHTSSFAAESPQLIPFQGTLVNSQNQPWADGKYSITFAIYGLPVGGTPVWTERHEKAGISGGLVNVFLGSINPFLKENGVWESNPDNTKPHNVDFGTTKYLGITVDADGNPATPDKEMSPRQIVLTGFYAPTTDRLQDHGWDVLFGNQDPASRAIQLTKTPTVSLGHIPDFSIQGANLDPEVTKNALASLGQVGVPSGGIIASVNANDTALLTHGYSRIGSIGSGHIGEGWIQGSVIGAPSPREDAAVAWTGSEILVWGGEGSTGTLADGAKFNRATQTWTPIATANAPSARKFGHYGRSMSVWTGSRLIVWGGLNSSYQTLGDGATYDPVSDTWTALPTLGAPYPRANHMVVFMPERNELFIWGGIGAHNADGGIAAGWTLNTGAILSLASGTWRLISSANAPGARWGSACVWTGSEVIIWSGSFVYSDTIYNDGARYNPATDTWTPVSAAGAPAGRAFFQPIWTGSEMIVFGGYGYGVEQAVAGGGRYSPSTNSWQNIDSAGQPSARYGWAGAWTGTEMIVQGGNTTTGPTYSDGALYNPSRNAWTPAMGSGPGRERYGASSLWTGEELWLFGGRNAARQLISEPVAYIPPRTLYLYQKN